MAQNKMDLIIRLANKIEAQGGRLKRLIDKFYPDGVRAEFAKAPQIGKTMMDSPAVRRFSEDEQVLLKCLKITEDVKKIKSESIEIDFYCTSLTFKNTYCVDYNACIMFKVTMEDTTIYVREGFVMEGVMVRFLIDSEEKEAFLVLEDFDLSNTMEGVELMVSFSQEEGKCCVEEIYKTNWHLLEKLFPPKESKEVADEPATCFDSQSEATSEVSDQLSPESDSDIDSPTIPNSDDLPCSDDTDNEEASSDISLKVKDAPPAANNDSLSPKKRGRPAKMKPKVDEEDATPSEPTPKAPDEIVPDKE